MAPAEAWGEDFLYGVDTYDAGVAAFAAHYATSEPPRYPQRDGGELDRGVGRRGGLAGGHRADGPGRQGGTTRPRRRVAALFPAPTVADPSRAPEGHHTVKVLGMQPYDPGGGPEQWERCARDRRRPPEPSAPGGAESRAGDDARGADRDPDRPRALEPAHVARHLPRRRPLARPQRRAAPRARLGAAPDADSRPVPDRRHDASGRLGDRADRDATPRS